MGCKEIMDISNHMDKTSNFYTPSKKKNLYELARRDALRLERDQVVMIKDLLQVTNLKYYHLIVLEKDTK